MRDTEIIERVLAGDTHAYRLLVERYQARAMTLALRMLGNREDAEEALQDSFVRAFNGLARFEGKSTFSTWLYRIVFNVCTTVLRQRGRAPHRIADEVLLDLQPAVPVAEHPDFRMEGEEFERIVAESIEALPRVYREAFTLFVLEELSYDRIADVMDLPLNTVKTRIFRARALLRAGVVQRLTDAAGPDEIDIRERT